MLDKGKGKAPKSAHHAVAHRNIGINQDLFNASLASCKNAWLLDLGENFHMSFRRDFFEQFTDNVDGAIYFVDKSKLKPSGPNFLVFQIFFYMMFYTSES